MADKKSELVNGIWVIEPKSEHGLTEMNDNFEYLNTSKVDQPELQYSNVPMGMTLIGGRAICWKDPFDVVALEFGVQVAERIVNGAIVGVLPVGYRPEQDKEFDASFFGVDTGFTNGTVMVYTNGYITIGPVTPLSTQDCMYFNFSFIAKG